MNIEICIKKVEHSDWIYYLREITESYQTYRLPKISHDVLRFTSFSQSTFVIEKIAVDPAHQEIFLKTLVNRLQHSYAKEPANIQQATELAHKITRVLPQLADADMEGQFEAKLDEMFCGSYLFTIYDEPGSILTL